VETSAVKENHDHEWFNVDTGTSFGLALIAVVLAQT
jgi:hypothetical protein